MAAGAIIMKKILCVMVSLQRLLCVFFRTDYIVSDTYEQNMNY